MAEDVIVIDLTQDQPSVLPTTFPTVAPTLPQAAVVPQLLWLLLPLLYQLQHALLHLCVVHQGQHSYLQAYFLLCQVAISQVGK